MMKTIAVTEKGTVTMAEYIIKVGEEGYEKPTVIQELVRCKDCKWYGYYSCEMGGNNWMRDGNGFCDRGERKDGEQYG